MQKESQEQGTVVRRQREKIQNGQTGIRGLETRVGQECCISRGGGGRLYSGGIHVGGVRGGSHSDSAGGQLQE